MFESSLIIGKRKGVSNWIRQFKTFVNLDKKLFKIQESFLGLFKWGAYEPLPKIEYVLVFKQLFAKCESCSVDEYENNPHSYFQVSLIYNKNRRIIVHETKNKEEAFDLAATIANGLSAPLKDSATIRGKSSWVKLK